MTFRRYCSFLSLVMTAACADVVYRNEVTPGPAPFVGSDSGTDGDGGPGDGAPAPTPRSVETLYTGPGVDVLAVSADDLFVTGANQGFPRIFRIPKEPPRKPWSFVDDLADPTTDRLRMGATDSVLYYEVTSGDLRAASKDDSAPGAVHSRIFLDRSLGPKLAAISAGRIAYLVHDGLLTKLLVWGEASPAVETVIGKQGLVLGPVTIDATITVFIQRPAESVVRYEPNEGLTTLGTLPALALAIALDDASVYAAIVGGRVLQVPRTGGAPQELLAGLGEVTALASTGNELLVLTGGAKGRLIGCKPASCSATQRDLLADVENPVGLSVDGAWIYVAERGPAAGSGRVRHVQRAP